MSTRSLPGAVALWVLVGILAGAVAMVFVLSARIDDDSQELTDADSISALDAAVFAKTERRVVGAEVIFRATVLPDDGTADVEIRASGIVTNIFASDGVVPPEFEVIVELDGRPLFPVEGAFAFYRRITFEDEGPDVRQLQELLLRAGADLEVDGVFGSKTQSALSDLYAAHGYSAPTGADESLVEGADQAVQALVRVVEDSELEIDRVLDKLAEARKTSQPKQPNQQEQIEQLEIEQFEMNRQLKRTLEALESARRAAREARSQAGAALVPEEFWVVDNLPVLDEVVLQIGDILDEGGGVLAQTKSSETRLTGSPTPGDATLLEEGQLAHVEAVGGETLVGEIVIAGVVDGVVTVEVVVDGVALDDARSYEVTVPSDEEPVESLAVPVTAVNQRLGADPFVVVVANGELVEIPVQVIASSRGWTAVLDPSRTLEDGTQVVVGFDIVAN